MREPASGGAHRRIAARSDKALAQRQRHHKGTNRLRGASPAHSGRAEDALCRGRALLAEGRLGEAVQALRRALAVKSELAEAHYYLGNAAWNQGHIAAALASYRRAVVL